MPRAKKNHFLPYAVAAVVIFVPIHVTLKNWLGTNTPNLISVHEGDTIENFTLTDTSGTLERIDEITKDNKFTLIAFWSTTCPICRPELTHLSKLATKYKDRGLKIITVNIDPNKATLVKYLSKSPASLPIYHDPNHLIEQKLGIQAVPTSIIITSKRLIREIILGSTVQHEGSIESLIKYDFSEAEKEKS